MSGLATGDRLPDGTHWTDEGAWAVAPGIHRIPLPLPMDGLRAVNVYVIETEQGLTLIDGGWAIEVARRLLERALGQIGYQLSDITRFLVTHAHRDHYTQAVTVGREFGARVSLGIGDKPTLDMIQSPVAPDDNPQVQMLRTAGAFDLAKAWRDLAAEEVLDPADWAYPDTWLEADRELEVGERVLHAVSTPGHTQGHFVFADHDAGLLFAGDHVLPTITPSIGFEPNLSKQPLGDFLASLIKVRQMPDLRLLPAHGPVTESSHARIDELLAHHDQRLALSLAAVHEGGSTAYDVARAVPWTRHQRDFGELDVFNGALATLETRAHLELLVARGELSAESEESGESGRSATVYRRIAAATPHPASGR